jgi:AcrR family transcriptional regulator
MDNTETDILQAARRLFMKFGIKSISMDDIARELGVSKKTLYKYFESKKKLVHQVILSHLEEEEKVICGFQEDTKDAIEQMVQVTQFISAMLRDLKPTTIYDLQKYHRKSWDMLESQQRKCMYEFLISNLASGKEQGHYRENINDDIIARFYTGSAHLLLDDRHFPSDAYTKEELYQNYIDYHLHAIMTLKGKEWYKKLKDR